MYNTMTKEYMARYNITPAQAKTHRANLRARKQTDYIVNTIFSVSIMALLTITLFN